MITRTLALRNKLGLHARAASRFVKAASAFQAQIAIAAGGKTADGKSIMGVMTLGAAVGTEVVLTASGVDEAEAMAALVALVEGRFGEGE